MSFTFLASHLSECNTSSQRIISNQLCLSYSRFSTSKWKQIKSKIRTYKIIKMKRQINLQKSYRLKNLFQRYYDHYHISTSIKYKSLYCYYCLSYSQIYTKSIHNFSSSSLSRPAVSPFLHIHNDKYPMKSLILILETTSIIRHILSFGP